MNKTNCFARKQKHFRLVTGKRMEDFLLPLHLRPRVGDNNSHSVTIYDHKIISCHLRLQLVLVLAMCATRNLSSFLSR